jgi:hypothetical protein
MFYLLIKCSNTDQAVSADIKFGFIHKTQISHLNRLWKNREVVEVTIYSFLNLGARRGRWSMPRSGCFNPGKETRYPCTGGCVGSRSRSTRLWAIQDGRQPQYWRHKEINLKISTRLWSIQDGRQPQCWRHKEINFKIWFTPPLFPSLSPFPSSHSVVLTSVFGRKPAVQKLRLIPSTQRRGKRGRGKPYFINLFLWQRCGWRPCWFQVDPLLLASRPGRFTPGKGQPVLNK